VEVFPLQVGDDQLVNDLVAEGVEGVVQEGVIPPPGHLGGRAASECFTTEAERVSEQVGTEFKPDLVVGRLRGVDPGLLWRD
jgi:hypothetical protein